MNSSITIHNLPDKLNQKIRELAKKENQSLNKTIKKLLTKQLGLTTHNPPSDLDEFKDLCGIWSNEEYEQFQNNINDFNIINPIDWQ